MRDGTTSKAIEPAEAEAAAVSGDEESADTPESEEETATEQEDTSTEDTDGDDGKPPEQSDEEQEDSDKGLKKLTTQKQVQLSVKEETKPKSVLSERDRELAELNRQLPEKPTFKEYTEKDLKEISDRLGALKQEIKGFESDGNYLEAAVKAGEYKPHGR